MPTYIYETTDPSRPPRQFEVQQSIHDAPLIADPVTGEPARRIISAGYSIHLPGKSMGPSVGSVGSHDG
jgi:predicted nucleic acid-binding Zn ribbon protein